MVTGTNPKSATYTKSAILALNAGSSSIRFGLFDTSDQLAGKLRGKLDLSGVSGGSLTVNGEAIEAFLPSNDASRPSSAERLFDWLEVLPEFAAVQSVGHRVVHGMQYSVPEKVTPELIADLRRNVPFDLQHLPLEIELMEAISRRCPALPQVACFDTAFHRSMPRVARVLPIPRRYEALGVRRYGFHGLSYEFLMQELARLDVPAAKNGRVILAHLGNGASLAAVRNGQCIDTSMGFTPASGLVMGTRSGDLDPGVISFLARSEKMSVQQFEEMTNHASGLLGISEISADMRQLLACEPMDLRAAEAVAIFCYQIRKWIGSFAAVLGGLDVLVFAGGIGENLPEIRHRICEDLTFLGVTLSEPRNTANAQCISTDGSRAAVHVIRTDEELVIAQSTRRTLERGAP
jgi:acetate kinase